MNLRTSRQELQRQVMENERLLMSLLPASGAAQVRDGNAEARQSFADVTVAYVNFDGFESLPPDLGEGESMGLLSDIVAACDEAAEEHGVEKVRTIGSSYLAVSGLSVERPDHTARMVQFANDVVQAFTGKRGVFGSRIAFAMSGRSQREFGSVDMDGGRMAVLTKMGSDNLLPAYSPGGAEIAFTSYARNNPDLWIVSAGGGRARRVSRQPGLNTGATWSPDGRSIALTLSHEGNSEIYRISPDDGRVLARLTQSPAIDSSPSYSPDGSQIAFVSNRQGSPQIFVMPAGGGAAKRVTFQGKYNQTPRFSPRTDKPQIAFTGRDEKGVFDVFILDLKTSRIDRIQPQARGSNLDPAWSPDGRLLAYASSRGGIFVYNPETRHEVQIWKGSASSLTWGPAPRR